MVETLGRAMPTAPERGRNVYDVLDCRNLLVTQEALTKLEERLTP